MASTYLTRSVTTTQADSARYKFTVSVWVKTSEPVSSSTIWQDYYSDAYRTFLRFDTGIIAFKNINNSSASAQLVTNQIFSDVNGWYHIIVVGDSTQATASDRLKMYVNGEQVTSFSSSTYPSQNTGFELANNNWTQYIGARNSGGTIGTYFSGSMSHFHYTESYAYAPTDFGETDATTGEWKIKTSPSITYGTNGFFILKDGNSVTDQSPNTNNFTVGGGTLTKTEDCPSNVFTTLNSLYLSASKWNLIQGSTRTNGWSSGTAQTWRSLFGTIGASSGKYYFEVQINDMTGDNGTNAIGIVSDDQVVETADNGKFFETSRGYAYAANGQKLNNDSSVAGGDSYGATFTINDIIGCAFDLDNHKIYWSKNGTWQDSGDPTSGSTGTGSAFNLATGYTYLPAFGNYYDDDRLSFNFGNGYFGATAVSSAGTNASNNGIFEYDVPTGFTALSTKGLNL